MNDDKDLDKDTFVVFSSIQLHQFVMTYGNFVIRPNRCHSRFHRHRSNALGHTFSLDLGSYGAGIPFRLVRTWLSREEEVSVFTDSQSHIYWFPFPQM